MKKVSVSDVGRRSSELIREVETGTVVVIERRGKAVAELHPLSQRRAKFKLPDMSRFWNEFPKIGSDSGRM